jgi:transposase
VKQTAEQVASMQRWPTATALAATSRQDLVAFARAAHSGYPERFADRVG